MSRRRRQPAAVAVADWRDAEDSKEKRNLYYCSREWGVLREAVRQRSGGICERCKKHPMDACHHVTYERLYCERLEDLQAICEGCHQFLHGKSEEDPAAETREQQPESQEALFERMLPDYFANCKAWKLAGAPVELLSGLYQPEHLFAEPMIIRSLWRAADELTSCFHFYPHPLHLAGTIAAGVERAKVCCGSKKSEMWRVGSLCVMAGLTCDVTMYRMLPKGEVATLYTDLAAEAGVAIYEPSPVFRDFIDAQFWLAEQAGSVK